MTTALPDREAPAAVQVDTVDYHTAGEPFRIVVGGAPVIPGDSVAERRAIAI
ncbi:proline racemase family protein, partial [Streptomyces sp. NRRL S-495]